MNCLGEENICNIFSGLNFENWCEENEEEDSEFEENGEEDLEKNTEIDVNGKEEQEEKEKNESIRTSSHKRTQRSNCLHNQTMQRSDKLQILSSIVHFRLPHPIRLSKLGLQYRKFYALEEKSCSQFSAKARSFQLPHDCFPLTPKSPWVVMFKNGTCLLSGARSLEHAWIAVHWILDALHYKNDQWEKFSISNIIATAHAGFHLNLQHADSSHIIPVHPDRWKSPSSKFPGRVYYHYHNNNATDPEQKPQKPVNVILFKSGRIIVCAFIEIVKDTKYAELAFPRKQKC
jgi:TATA-box binding protein (TBP) (component of TFIID and TFIIIB)